MPMAESEPHQPTNHIHGLFVQVRHSACWRRLAMVEILLLRACLVLSAAVGERG